MSSPSSPDYVALVDGSGKPVYGPTSVARLLTSGASDNATVVATGSRTINGIQGVNARATPVYLKLYNKATAPTNVDVPLKTLELPAASAFVFDFTAGVVLSLGLGYRITVGIADNDATAIAAGDVRALNLDYI